MYSYTGKTKENDSKAVSNNLSQPSSQRTSIQPETGEESEVYAPSETSATLNQMGISTAYQLMANESPQVKQLRQIQAMADSRQGSGYMDTGQAPQVIQRVINADDVPDIPVDHRQRVLDILNQYNEEAVRENLELLTVVFSTVENWGAYTEQDIRDVITDAIPVFRLDPGASNNPWLHILQDDFGVTVPRLLVNDTDEVDGYIALAQTCSVMSIVWLRDTRAAGNYSIRTAGNPEAVARAIYANQNPDDQFNWAEQQTGLTRVNAAPTVEQLRALGVGGRFILYSPVHVSAGTVSENGFLYYDPETGSASQVSNEEMGIYVAAAARYLHS